MLRAKDKLMHEKLGKYAKSEVKQMSGLFQY